MADTVKDFAQRAGGMRVARDGLTQTELLKLRHVNFVAPLRLASSDAGMLR